MIARRTIIFALLLTASGSFQLAGQTPSGVAVAADSTSTGRTWSIDIAQREIVEGSFADAASAVAVDEEGRWYVCAGAAVTADEVRIRLTNVQAEVHLRADVDRLRDLLGDLTMPKTMRSDARADGMQDRSCESPTGQLPGNQSPDQPD